MENAVKMRRYTDETVGFIRFPDTPKLDLPLGGGMYVTLTVFEKRENSRRWGPPLIAAPELNLEDSLMGAFGHRHGRYYHDGFMKTGVPDLPLLAHITLGATGRTFEDWIATTGNLTESGWRLWNTMNVLYDHELWLLTWLDT